MRAHVLGMGLWMPGFPDAASWLSGRAVEGADSPNAQSKQRRRSSLLVNMVADVAAQASAAAGVPLSRLRVVVGSAFGELTTLVEMLEERERDGLLSTLRFQNSVHNSAAGQLSIASKNKAAAMSMAAGNDTVAMVLLEAMTLLALGGDEVLAIVADEPLPAAIWPGLQTPQVAAALVLAAHAGAPAAAVRGRPRPRRALAPRRVSAARSRRSPAAPVGPSRRPVSSSAARSRARPESSAARSARSARRRGRS